MPNIKYTIAQITEILKKADEEKRCVVKIATEKAVMGQANSVFLSLELEIEPGRFVPYPDVEPKNIITSSNMTHRKDAKGARQNTNEVAVSIMPVTEEELAETNWKPETFPVLVAATNAYMQYADLFDTQTNRAIENDILKKIAVLGQKGIVIPKRNIVDFIQRERKIKPTDDPSKALESGKMPLEKPITRIVAKLDKATDRIGYMPKEKVGGKPPSFMYTFKTKGKKNPKTGKNDLIVLRIPDQTGKPQDLTGTNCHMAITRRSIITGTITPEIIISAQGISKKIKFRSAVVHPHAIIQRNDISDEAIDELDAFGDAYVPTYVAPADDTDTKERKESYTGMAPLTGAAEQSINFEEPEANPIDDEHVETAADADADTAADADAETADDAAEDTPAEPPLPPPPAPKPVATRTAAKPKPPGKK